MGAQATEYSRAAPSPLAPVGEPADAAAVAGRVMSAALGALDILAIALGDRFTAPGSDLDRLLYGFSLLICLPDSMSTPGSTGTGTVLRPRTMREYAAQAGYSRVDILPIDHDLWRFYHLHP